MKRIWDEVMSPRRRGAAHTPTPPPCKTASKKSAGQPESPNQQRSKAVVGEWRGSPLALSSPRSYEKGTAILSRERRLPYKDHADIVQTKVDTMRKGATNLLKHLNLSHEQYTRRAKSEARRELQRLKVDFEERVAAEREVREAQTFEVSRMKQTLAEVNQLQVELIDRERVYRIKAEQEARAYQGLVGQHAEVSAELERLRSTTVELDEWTEKIRNYRSIVDDLLTEQTKLVSAAETVDDEIRFADSFECRSRRLQLLNRIRKQRISQAKEDTDTARTTIPVADEGLQMSQPVFQNWRESCTELIKHLLCIVDRSLEGYAILHRALNCPLCEKPLDKDPMINDEGVTYCSSCSQHSPKLCADTPNSVIESILSRFPANLQFESFLGSLKEALDSEVDRIMTADIAKLVKHYKAYVTLLETNNGRFDTAQLLALKRKDK